MLQFLNVVFAGGFMKGYRTYLLGAALAIQALGQYLAGDATLSEFLGQLPEILGGMGLMALRAGVDKAVKIVEGLEASGVVGKKPE